MMSSPEKGSEPVIVLRRLPLFMLLGLLFAIPGEILNQVLARRNVGAFGKTMVSYVILLFVGFFVCRRIWAKSNSRSTAALRIYLLFGFLGLMVEWFLLGNSPVLDPFQVITQPGMFTFWATLLLGPGLMMERARFGALKKSFAAFFAIFSLLYLTVAIAIPKDKGGIFFGFIIFAAGTAALNYFYFKYYKLLSEESREG